MKQQSEITKVTTQHTINYKGNVIVIKGKHESKFATKSKMDFSIHCENQGVSFGTKSTKTFRERLDYLLNSVSEAKAYKVKSDAFKTLHQSLSTAEKIAHSNFAYARFQKNSGGNYYNIYWRSQLSPTGVELIGGCTESEWETISKATSNSHNYYSPTENRMSAR